MKKYIYAPRSLTLIACGIVAAAAALAANAASRAGLSGDYIGRVGQLPVVLHVTTGPDGRPGCTVDSPSQNARGLPCAEWAVEGSNLSFKVPVVQGSWKGTIEDDGATLNGTWSQGAPLPLVFRRDDFVPQASPLDGTWLGTLTTPQGPVRGQVTFQGGSRGELRCEIDIIEQAAFNLPCENARLADGALSFEFPLGNGRWEGRVSADGNALAGLWQARNPDGTAAPPQQLDFARQAQRIRSMPLTYDEAIAPVGADRIETVLREDMKKTLASGALAPGKGVGAAIGIVTPDGRQVFTLGEAKPDALFEIGSITKTFTGLLLAQLIEQGKVRADMPVRELLPSGTAAKPAGAEVTVHDLVTQHSGLPRMPDNFQPGDPANPYADYDRDRLYAFVGRQGLARAADAGFLYSNVGFGLLGQALANATDQSWETLVREQVLAPLSMTDTAAALSPAQQARFIAPHAGDGSAAHSWELDALAGAGALRSTASDMLRYLEAQLAPGRLRPTGAAGGTLAAAIRRSQALQADAGPSMRIAYGWLFDKETGNYWHNGGTGGFSSWAFFNPESGYAAIVMVNLGPGSRGSLADALGMHVVQRLAGKPAISLERW